MSTALEAFLIFIGVGSAVWLISFVVEFLRATPAKPRTLRWAPDIPIEHVDVGGNTLRYIKTGNGPALVLLHTLRTQLDLFEKVVPELSRHFTVYALDYPGHGFSDIPHARYHAAYFTNAVESFLERLDLRDVTLAGVSIGGAIGLIVAAKHNPRVVRCRHQPLRLRQGPWSSAKLNFRLVPQLCGACSRGWRDSHAAPEFPNQWGGAARRRCRP
jgi:alpha/beta hydrolase family protein